MAKPLKAVETDDAIEAQPEPVAMPVTTAKILLTVDHVWLPINRLDPNWRGSNETEKVDSRGEDGKRIRFEVSASLAAFLAERDQAEILE